MTEFSKAELMTVLTKAELMTELSKAALMKSVQDFVNFVDSGKLEGGNKDQPPCTLGRC